MTLCSDDIGYQPRWRHPEDEGSMVLQNADILNFTTQCHSPGDQHLNAETLLQSVCKYT